MQIGYKPHGLNKPHWKTSHEAEGYNEKGFSSRRAKEIAWNAVNKQTGAVKRMSH